MENKKIPYTELLPGHEFPPASFCIDKKIVSEYNEAVQEGSGLYSDGTLIPPMAIAARAMATLADGFILPGGTIHVSQEFEFLKMGAPGETFTSHSVVERKQDRGKLHLLIIKLTVLNDKKETVVTGKTGFVLPE